MIATLVEGQAEVESFPVILRRFQTRTGAYDVQIARPIRVKRNRIVKDGELEKSAALVLKTYPDARAIVLLLDADDDCPKQLAPGLLARLEAAFPHGYCSVILAYREVEAWFLASAHSLSDAGLLRTGSTAPDAPEAVRGAKEWLSSRLDNGYVSTDDQPRFAANFSFEEAIQRCRSFRKLDKDVSFIFGKLVNG